VARPAVSLIEELAFLIMASHLLLRRESVLAATFIHNFVDEGEKDEIDKVTGAFVSGTKRCERKCFGG
jgi:hypothetical protein